MLFAALIGWSIAPADAASAVPGLRAASGSTVVQVNYYHGGRHYEHRRWRNHHWDYY
jgi:hypothetical protein